MRVRLTGYRDGLRWRLHPDEPELGFLLVCSLDYDIADGAGVTLERSQTIMQGSDHCDFRFSGVDPAITPPER